LLARAKQQDIPAFLLGGGNNTLFATSYFDGLVFTFGRQFSHCTWDGGLRILAGASVKITKLLQTARECGLMGLEFMTMVPGTVGGSLAGNAGAGGQGICDKVETVWLMTREGFLAEVTRHDYLYTYRHSELRDAIVLAAEFKLEPLDVVESERRVEGFKAKKKGQPYNVPSSGCIFKNPVDPQTGLDVSAGKLIDLAGLKGYSIRSAMVDMGHANFMVNTGEASGEDFLALMSLVRDIVGHRHNVDLDLEVQVVGGPMSTAILS